MSASQLEIGDQVSVQLRLDNRDSLPIAWVLIEDTLPREALFGPPPALSLSGEQLRICTIPAKASRIVTYKLKALRRGYFQIGPTLAETGDLFGLHRRFRLITQPTYLLVLPKLVPLQGYDVASSRPIGEMRRHVPHAGGPNDDLRYQAVSKRRSVAEYSLEGDSPHRRIAVQTIST